MINFLFDRKHPGMVKWIHMLIEYNNIKIQKTAFIGRKRTYDKNI